MIKGLEALWLLALIVGGRGYRQNRRDKSYRPGSEIFF